MPIFIFFTAIWYLSLFSQTFFHHRYASHGAFKMTKPWERFFFILTYLSQGAHYISPAAYAVMHRLHHAYTDTERDPHSPNFSPNVFSMMIRTRRIYRGIFNGKIKVEERFTKNLPVWKSFDKIATSLLSRLLWAAGYILFFIFFASSWWLYFLLPVIILMSLFHGAIINWSAHKTGYRNFKLKNTSKNLFPMSGILMLGESYHNNHHKYPSRINFGVKWFEFDPVYLFIRLLARLRIIKLPAQSLEHSTSLLHEHVQAHNYNHKNDTPSLR